MQCYNFGRRISQNNCSNNNLLNTNCNNDLLPEQVVINTSTNFNCFLQNYIGKKCSCEFIVGDNLVKRTGTLSEVGNNFLILASLNNGTNILFCDTANLIFVKIE